VLRPRVPVVVTRVRRGERAVAVREGGLAIPGRRVVRGRAAAARDRADCTVIRRVFRVLPVAERVELERGGSVPIGTQEVALPLGLGAAVRDVVEIDLRPVALE